MISDYNKNESDNKTFLYIQFRIFEFNKNFVPKCKCEFFEWPNSVESFGEVNSQVHAGINN